MKGYWFIASALCLTSCMVSNALQYDSVAYDNIYHIARLHKGMNEREVLFIMRQPYSYESFEIGEDVYDIWFYVTQTTILDQSRMVARNLTPLTFKNGILVGTGYDYYYFVTRANAKQMQQQAAPSPAEQQQIAPTSPEKPSTEMENVEFEKALKMQQNPEQAPAQEVPLTGPAPENQEPPPAEQPPQTAPKSRQQQPPAPTSPSSRPSETPATASVVPPLKSLKSKLGARNLLFSKIQKGMTETEVLNILGEPHTYESYEKGEDVYDVWIYSAGPLTFKNSVLVGMTTEYYQGLKESADETQINGYDQAAEQMQHQESDQNFNYW